MLKITLSGITRGSFLLVPRVDWLFGGFRKDLAHQLILKETLEFVVKFRSTEDEEGRNTEEEFLRYQAETKLRTGGCPFE